MEQLELAIWTDDTRAWPLADSIRIRAALLWDEWKEASKGGEQCLWLAQERAGRIARQLHYRLGELLHIEMTQHQQPKSA